MVGQQTFSKMINLHFGAYLNFYIPGKKSRLSMALVESMPLKTILANLEIPLSEINLAAINNVAVDISEAIVNPGDSIDLYPPMDGG